MAHPYKDLPPQAFWRSAVAERHPLHIDTLWAPKFQVKPEDRIVTAGSCFAQHFSRAIVERGYTWMDAEPAPALLKPEDEAAYNYGIFSFRTGNIYTARILLQWLELAFEKRDPIEDVWEKNGRYYDPLRPAIEPNGFASPEELLASRLVTCHAIRRAVKKAGVFVFTMGLTESWQNVEGGFEYAICPGTMAGQFDAKRDHFENQDYDHIQRDMRAAIRLITEENPDIRILLTVSPVPLTATATGEHVLVATTHSKSILRAVAGAMAAQFDHVDYFPSYEIITNAAFGGQFYAPNKRSVVPEGVAFVMKTFFSDQERMFGKVKPAGKPKGAVKPQPAAASGNEAVKCEEEMLDAFGKK